MDLTIRLDADANTLFAPNAFHKNVGKEVRMKGFGPAGDMGRIKDIEVIEGGKAVLITFGVHKTAVWDSRADGGSNLIENPRNIHDRESL